MIALTPPQTPLLGSFFLDVTDHPEHLAESHRMVADAYAEFLTESAPSNELIDELTQVPQNDLSTRTYALFGRNPNTNQREMLGTIRTTAPGVLESSPQDMEAMHLLRYRRDWSEFRYGSFDMSDSVEFSRVAVAANIRVGIAYRTKFHQAVVVELFRRAYLASLVTFGRRQGWAILPANIRHILAKSQAIKCLLVPGTHFNEVRNGDFYNRFAGYWRKRNPRFCKLLFDEDGNDPVAKIDPANVSSCCRHRGHC